MEAIGSTLFLDIVRGRGALRELTLALMPRAKPRDEVQFGQSVSAMTCPEVGGRSLVDRVLRPPMETMIYFASLLF
jgi:hypothetical protein